MKKLSLISTILSIMCLQCFAQEHKEKINKEFALPSKDNGVLILANINGSIDVEGYDGDKIILEIEKYIYADEESDLQKGIKEMGVEFDLKGDSLYAYLKGPFQVRFQYGGWQYSGNWEDRNYDYKFDFKIKVPNSLNLQVSTVNKGYVNVSNIDARSIKTNNVNGKITLHKISGETRAHTVNGDIKVTYTKNPEGKSSFRTINGDIEVFCLKSLSTSIGFDTMNGDMFTDFEDLTYLPAKMVKETKKSGKKTTYKIDYKEAFQIGEGNHTMEFKTLNGDVYLKKI